MRFIAFFSLSTNTHTHTLFTPDEQTAKLILIWHSSLVSNGCVPIILMHFFFILLFVLSLLIFKIFQFYYLVVASFGQKTISFSSQRRLDGQEYFQNACVFVRWTEDVWKNQMCTHMRQISSHMGTINNHMQWILAFITDWACVFPFLYYYFLIFFLWTRNISVALKNKYCNEKLQIINNRHKKCVCCYVCCCSNYWNDEKYSKKKSREKNRRISMLRDKTQWPSR